MATTDANLVKNVGALRLEFLKTLKEGSPEWKSAMMLLDGSGGDGTTNLPFASDAPKMRRWVDERMPATIRSGKYTVIHDRYENSLAFTKMALRRDNLGLAPTRIKDMATRARNFPLVLASQLRRQGAAAESLCWDESPFFYNAHVYEDSGAQSNKHAQTSALAAGVRTDFYVGKKARIGWKDSQGEVDDNAAIMLDLVVVHGLETLQVMDEVFQTERNADGSTNVTYQAARLQLDPRIVGTGWVLEDHGGIVKPYGLVEEMPVTLENSDVSSDEGFMRGEVRFGTEWVGSAFYGDPACAHLVGSIS